ncbi:MAG: UbiH/UbiF/VisC/COQ6 family ubiquinone biosynthesis hydroxylase, partial [Qingshengfaniella sp.]
MERYDTIVIGASLNGASLALALTGAGFSVALVDPMTPETQENPRFDGRSYALAPASVRMLDVLGLWQGLAENAQPMLKIEASDGRPGEGTAPQVLSFDHAELEEGPLGQMIEDRHLRQALQARLKTTPDLTYLPGRRVVAQRTDGPAAEADLDDGTCLKAAVIVGADGKTGPTASRAGIRRTVTSYRQSALVCAIRHALPHHGTAHQLFMPAGPLAILPLQGNRSSIVWSETTRQAKEITKLDDESFLQILRPRFGDFLGEITLEGDRYSYPLTRSLATSFTAPRLALVGDAARAVHPLAGQGLNAGLRDVAALAEVLTEARRRGEDIGRTDVLTRYARWRRFDSTTLAMATTGFNILFSNDNPALRLGRDLGMGLVNALPGVKRTIMREAAGLTGDLPRLMAGRP